MWGLHVPSPTKTTLRRRRRDPRPRRQRDDTLPGLRPRLRALGATAILFDALPPGRFEEQERSTAKACGRQGGHRLPVPALRGALPRRPILQRLWGVLPQAG